MFVVDVGENLQGFPIRCT